MYVGIYAQSIICMHVHPCDHMISCDHWILNTVMTNPSTFSH